jgi:hypothetical protein
MSEGRENVCVSVRVRPINKREEETQENIAWRVLEGTNIVPSEHNPRRSAENSFAFGGCCQEKEKKRVRGRERMLAGCIRAAQPYMSPETLCPNSCLAYLVNCLQISDYKKIRNHII